MQQCRDSDSGLLFKKAKRDAGPKHVCDGKFRHPHGSIGKIRHQHRLGRSITYVDGGLFRPIHVSGLHHAWLFNSGCTVAWQNINNKQACKTMLKYIFTSLMVELQFK
jgi:hypothetical protein